MSRETNYFKSFCKISKAFGTAASKQERLDLIVHSAIDTMNGKAACLFLRDRQLDVFVPMAQQGLSDSYLHANPIQARRVVAALENEGYLAFPDATSDPRLDIKQILANLTEGICNTLGMKGALIRLLDEDTGLLRLVASHGLGDEFLEKGAIATTQTTTRALNGETIVISDATTDGRIHFKETMKKEGIMSMIVTPILAQDRVIGVMRLYSGVQRELPSDFIIMVKALAHQGGLAIQNASMYLRLQEDKRSLEEDIWSHRAWF